MTLNVLTAVMMKITIFWDVIPCSLIVTYGHLRGMYSLYLMGRRGRVYFLTVNMEIVGFPETLVNGSTKWHKVREHGVVYVSVKASLPVWTDVIF
jgi:hypothetical protein